MQLILPLECILVVWRTHKHVFFDLKLNAQQKSLNLQCDTNITNISFNISNLTQHCCHFKPFLPMGVCQAFANSGHFPMPPVNFCLANVPSCSGEGLVLLQFVTPPPSVFDLGARPTAGDNWHFRPRPTVNSLTADTTYRRTWTGLFATAEFPCLSVT